MLLSKINKYINYYQTVLGKRLMMHFHCVLLNTQNGSTCLSHYVKSYYCCSPIIASPFVYYVTFSLRSDLLQMQSV